MLRGMRHRLGSGIGLWCLYVLGLAAVLSSVVVPLSRQATTPSLAVPAKALHQMPVIRHRIVVLGDSVAAATGCKCDGFGAALAKANGPATFTNEGEGGLTTEGLLSQLQSAGVRKALATATLVTITVGANDFDGELADEASCHQARCYGDRLRSTTANLNAIAVRVAALAPANAVVIFTGYWNVFLDGAVGALRGPDFVATSDRLSRQVNTAVATVAKAHHDRYADLYAPFKGSGSTDVTHLLAPDGDHPNAAGYALITSAIAASVGLATAH